MKIEEIIDRVQSLYSKGVSSDDTRLRSRHIYNKMISMRSLLLRQKANKNQRLNRVNYQTMGCVNIYKLDLIDCPTIPSVGTYIYRTKEEFPIIIADNNRSLIEGVTSLDHSVIYSETDFVAEKYKKGNRYTKNKPDFYFRDNHLYLSKQDKSTIIAVTAIFEDPIKAMEFSNCGSGDACLDYMELEFPLEATLVDALIELTAKELILLFGKGQEDKSNDASDNLIPISK